MLSLVLMSALLCNAIFGIQSFSIDSTSNPNFEIAYKKRLPRAAVVTDLNQLWPNGEIPYEIDATFSAEHKCQIEMAMYHLMWNSCIRFRKKTSYDRYSVTIINHPSEQICRATHIGLPERQSTIGLQLHKKCLNMGTILHQLMHLIGFYDEHTRHDRDNFLEINHQEMLGKAKLLLQKRTNSEEQLLSPFDYETIMLLGSNDLDTQSRMKAKKENVHLKSIFHKYSLSKVDIDAINKLYSCPKRVNLSLDFIRQFVVLHNVCDDSFRYSNHSIPEWTKFKRNLAYSNAILFRRQRTTKESLKSKELIQGDILIHRKTYRNAKINKRIQLSAINVQTSEWSIWPGRVIPYELDAALESHKCLIENAMLQIMLNTCIRFRKRTFNDRFYFKIFQDSEPGFSDVCYATIGMNGNNSENRISLPDGCHTIGTVVHELMHIIGFYHAQNRQDRDRYLKINYENILPGVERQFKLNEPIDEQIFTPWDYNSVMLYGAKFFSKDGHSVTMEPTVEGVVLQDVFEKPGISSLDAVAIKQLYQCSNETDQNYYKDPHLIRSFLELVRSCPANSESLLYIYSKNLQ